MKKGFFLLCFLAANAFAEPLFLTTKDVTDPNSSFRLNGWKYKQALTDTRALPEDWSGTGVFELEVRPDENLEQKSLALFIRQGGELKLRLNGKLIQDVRSEERWLLNPFLISFPAGVTSILTVEYENRNPNYFRNLGMYPGFQISLQEWGTSKHYFLGAWYHFIFLFGVSAAFGLMHFSLFLFNRSVRSNLYFSLTAFCIAILILTEIEDLLIHRAEVVFMRRVWGITQIIATLAILRFNYALYRKTVPRQFYFFALAGILLLVWSWNHIAGAWIAPANAGYYISIFTVAALIESIRILFFSKEARKEKGIRMLRLGSIPVLLAALYQMLINVQVVEPLTTFLDYVPLPFYAFLVLLFSMSIYLSQRVAETNRNLEREESENRRKTADLEEARALQLSMLPQKVPQLDSLEVAFFMKTATEVGGDYYDYLVNNGVATFAIGDATGHGVKAGTMVAAVKGLFQALGNEEDVAAIFSKMSETLRRMKLGKNFMAMTITKIENHAMKFACAGMPPGLIFRRDTGSVEEIRTRGIPLGGTRFPYEQVELALNSGDAILLMSDGFPEMFNPEGKILGYNRASQILAECGPQTPQQIIDILIKEGETWSKGHSAEDDVTFIVLKVL